jgi:hypothetical protein
MAYQFAAEINDINCDMLRGMISDLFTKSEDWAFRYMSDRYAL